MAVSLHMLLQVTNMINIASTSTINTVVHRTTANLNTTRSTVPTNLVRVTATGSSPAANPAMVGHRQDHPMADLTVDHMVDLMAELVTGNNLMVGHLKNSLRSISTISMVERMSSWASTKHRMEVTEDRATTEAQLLQHGDKLQRVGDSHVSSIDGWFWDGNA